MGYVVNRGTKDRPKWYAKFKDLDGTWKQRHTKQITKAGALRFVAEIEARVARGEIGIPEPSKQELTARTLTVASLCDRFLKEYSRPSIKDLDGYMTQARCGVTQMVLPFPIASMVAAEVRPLHVQQWRDELRHAQYAPGTINRGLAVLSRVFTWAAEQEIITVRNPCGPVERMPAKPSEDHYSLDEVQRLLALPDLPPMVWTALYAGLRKGELFGLTWACVRLDGEIPRIEVRRSYTGPTKSSKPRTVPIHPELLPTLRTWREKCPQTPEGLVFPVARQDCKGRPAGWRMGIGRDMEELPELLRAAGCHVPVVQSVRKHDRERVWHAFRHTFATLFMEASGNGDALSKILGHSQGSGAALVTTGYTHTGLAYLQRELVKMTLLPPAPAGVASLDEARRKRAG